jgi:hypothetical protein
MLGRRRVAPPPKAGRARRWRGQQCVVSTVVPGLVRSDETPAEVHPFARPESRPPTDVRGDRDGDHRGRDVPPLSSVRIAGHRDRRLGKSFGSKAALARPDDLMVLCAVESGPPERIPHAHQFPPPSERPPVQCRGRDREARYADLPELDSGSLMQNPSRRIKLWCDRSQTITAGDRSAGRPPAECPGALSGARRWHAKHCR